jgi:hypothetical protein
MARFMIGSNNGVTALLTEEDYLLKQAHEPMKTGYFLFVDGLERSYFHGDNDLMHQLLTGHEVIGAALSVPFSNGVMPAWTREELISEFESLAPMGKALESFGVELVRASVSAA